MCSGAAGQPHTIVVSPYFSLLRYMLYKTQNGKYNGKYNSVIQPECCDERSRSCVPATEPESTNV